MKKCISIFLFFIIVSSVFLVRSVKAIDATQNNLIPNPGFEQTVTNSSWKNGIAPAGWGVWIPMAGGVVSVDTAVTHSGLNSVKIEQPTTARTNVSVTGGVAVTPGRNYKLGIWTKTQNLSSNGVIFRTYYYNGYTKTGDGPTLKVTGTNDWTNKELYINVPTNTSNVRVEVMFEAGTGVVWIDDVSLELYDGLSNITLDKNFIQLNKGDVIQINATLSPSNALDKTVKWSSSNPSVVDVVYGVLTAKDIGDATVRVATPDGKIYADCLVSVQSLVDYQMLERLRLKWYDRITGNSFYNSNDPDMVKVVKDAVNSVTNSNGTGLWDALNKSSGRTYLWSNYSSTSSADMTASYNALRTMAITYSYIGSELYHNQQLKNDIISALDWLYDNRYNERVADYYNNWWDYEIGTSKTLNDIMVLMYDDLTTDQINKYIKAIDRFDSDPTVILRYGNKATGANLLDKALAVTIRGIIGKSSYKVRLGSGCIGSEYLYATHGDGVYEDGSLIQHTYVAYTGAYGAVWLSDTAEMMYVLKDSPWTITDPNVNNVFNWISDTYEPVIYNSLMMDMVSGREISRELAGSARKTVLCIMYLAEGAPADKALAMKKMVKEWVQSDTTVTNYYDGMSIFYMSLLKATMNNPVITPRGKLIKDQVFAGMDRVVDLRESYGFGISMFSNRISAFEYGNEENIKGWYTGIGMTYLYNDDLLQYRNDYWPTVNMYRLAGTTTDGSYKTPTAWAPYYNPRNWVGGVTIDDLYSAAGMDFSLQESTGSSLQGKKSWFCFDNEIVALGSGISGGDGRNVETIIDNRKIKDEGDNVLTVDGQVKSSALGWNESMNNITWAHLKGNVPNTDIGYYFPNNSMETNIYGLREARTGSWKDLNTTQSSTIKTRNYVSLAFEHGITPADASYSYVLLPNRSADETKIYSDTPDIQIISNTNTVHAVMETRLGITAANFWTAGSVGDIAVDSPAAVMLKENGNELELSVSDPTQSQSIIVIELNKQGYELLDKDDTVEVLQTYPTIKVAVNVAGSLGKTHSVILKKKLIERVTITADKSILKLQTTSSVSVSGIMSDGTMADLTKARIMYSSDNEQVVTVDSLGNVTAIGEGTANLKATVILWGITKEDSISIIVDGTPPTTLAVTDKTAKDGWYRTDVQVELKSTDKTPGSGVREIHYQINDNPVNIVTGDFASFTVSTEGIHNIRYQAVDVAGNMEPEQSLTICIDKTAPEMEIGFNPESKKYIIHVLDTLSGPQANEITVTNTIYDSKIQKYLVKDKADNTIEISVNIKYEGHEAKLNILSILYNGGIAINPVENEMSTQWGGEAGVLKELEQKVEVKNLYEVKAKYRGKENLSVIKVKLNDKKDDDKKDSEISQKGMVVLRLQSSNGILICPQEDN